ncbi:MAG: hypothetical protein M0P71_01085 [Melioribacteraceae bacterium]|nr:hypothetical protein [Melioribacteraceae bacterium]
MSCNQVWVGADWHLGHSNIIKHNNRPWKNVEEMDEGLIENWNKVVGVKDLVYIVGDFAFQRHGYFINKLKGKKVLILGSHDKMPKIHLEQFQEVCEIKNIKALGHNWVMQHCCPRTWDKSHYCSVALFGHSHGRMNTQNLSFDVGVDVPENNYSPQPLEVYVERAQVRFNQMVADGRLYKDKHTGKELLYSDDLAWAMKKLRENEDVNSNIINRFV